MRFIVILSALAVWACSSEAPNPTSGNVGGAYSAGGGPAAGGAPLSPTGGSRWSSGIGGLDDTEGRTMMGGTPSTSRRSVSPQGGTSGSGGSFAGGGKLQASSPTSVGGSKTQTGGAPSNGGGNASGGDPQLGDSSVGGSRPTGTSTLVPVSAIDAAAEMGLGVNIGQTFESTQNERTLAAVSAKIDAYYAKGFRNVRIPITWTEKVGGDLLVGSATVGDVSRSHPRLAVIDQVVDYALSKPGLYVVINAHHETGLKTNSRAAVLERLWGDVAEIFATKHHRLLFEILNEPHRSDASNTAMPAADLRTMVRMAYAKIRAVDAARIVIIGGNQWFAANEMAAVWTDLSGVGNGQDPYLMATFHHYDPWTFCGDNQGSYDDPWTDANLSTPMQTMLTWAKTVGKAMPVYIGEWGVGWASRYTTMDCNNIRSWYEKMGAAAAANRIPTSLWDDNGWFKVWDVNSKTWNNNLVECLLGNCSWSGTERFNAGCK
jgi:endoglucanase